MTRKTVQRCLRIPQNPLRKPFLLSASILDKFSLGKHRSSDITVPESLRFIPPSIYRSNSHLSLLAMVDCWIHLGINSYVHLDLATTSLFRLFLGVAEHLFQSLTLLESALHPTIYDHWHRADNLEFVHCCKRMESMCSFWKIWRLQEEIRGGWETWQWDDQGSDGNWSHQGRRGKKRLGALSDCKVTIMIIKYSVRFSCSICGHRFHQISNLNLVIKCSIVFWLLWKPATTPQLP